MRLRSLWLLIFGTAASSCSQSVEELGSTIAPGETRVLELTCDQEFRTEFADGRWNANRWTEVRLPPPSEAAEISIMLCDLEEDPDNNGLFDPFDEPCRPRQVLEIDPDGKALIECGHRYDILGSDGAAQVSGHVWTTVKVTVSRPGPEDPRRLAPMGGAPSNEALHLECSAESVLSQAPLSVARFAEARMSAEATTQAPRVVVARCNHTLDADDNSGNDGLPTEYECPDGAVCTGSRPVRSCIQRTEEAIPEASVSSTPFGTTAVQLSEDGLLKIPLWISERDDGYG